MPRFRPLASALLPFAVLLLAACGPADTPEERLAAADEALGQARDQADDARSELASAQQRRAAAETELYDARKAVRRAEARVFSAQARLERRATDVALFRRIQRRLLEADALQRDAVVARVEGGQVTLEGTVEDDAARQAALEIARATPGVASVRDRLSVEDDEAS